MCRGYYFPLCLIMHTFRFESRARVLLCRSVVCVCARACVQADDVCNGRSFRAICCPSSHRIDSAASTCVRRSTVIFAPTHGQTKWQIHAVAQLRDVVRQKQAAARVLVQHTEKPHRRTVPLPQHMGATAVRRTGRERHQGTRLRAHPTRYRMDQGWTEQGSKLLIAFIAAHTHTRVADTQIGLVHKLAADIPNTCAGSLILIGILLAYLWTSSPLVDCAAKMLIIIIVFFLLPRDLLL